MRCIIHIDMDAFYASIEQRDNPAYRGLPVIIGGRAEDRGVVATASYEARVFGVHSAMPMAEARRRCPDGVFLPTRIDYYRAESLRLMQVFQSVTPEVEPLSVDEAFLDVTASRALYGEGPDIGRALQKRIAEELKLTASIGVSYNKFLAKLASDLEKPSGFVVIMPDDLETRVWPLPVGKMFGVGRIAREKLARLGITTIGDLAKAPITQLQPVLGSLAEDIRLRALGEDSRPVTTDRQAKSVGHETTFPTDLTDRYHLETVLLSLTDEVCWRLRRLGLKGRTVSLKWRYSDFSTVTRAHTFETYHSATEPIWQAAQTLFATHYRGRPLRLIGITVSNLLPETDVHEQIGLFDAPAVEVDKPLDAVVDALNARFGKDTVGRARLLTLQPPQQQEDHDDH